MGHIKLWGSLGLYVIISHCAIVCEKKKKKKKNKKHSENADTSTSVTFDLKL